MDETLSCLLMMAGIWVWRQLEAERMQGPCGRRIARSWFPRLGSQYLLLVGWVWKWYVLMLIMLICQVSKTFLNFWIYDIHGLHWLDEEMVEAEFNRTQGLSDKDRQALHLGPYLRMATLVGAFVGVAALAIVVIQVVVGIVMFVCRYLYHNHPNCCGKGLDGHNPWTLTPQHDLVLVMLFMPGVFIWMALRTQTRVLSLMIGSAYQNLAAPCPSPVPWTTTAPPSDNLWVSLLHAFSNAWAELGELGTWALGQFYNRSETCGLGWSDIKRLESTTGELDMENAMIFQYVAVYAFVQLCLTFFRRGDEEQLTKDPEMKSFRIDRATFCCMRKTSLGRVERREQDVTERVNFLISCYGARNITNGEHLVDALELKTIELGHAARKLRVERGRHTQDFKEAHLICNLWKRRRFNLSWLEDHADYYWSLKWAGLLGVWCYILGGLAHSLFNVSIMFLKATARDEGAQQGGAGIDIYVVHDRVMSVLSPVTGTFTLLAIVNMSIIVQIKDLNDSSALGSTAGLKFLATRILLLAGQMQTVVLHFWVPDKSGTTKISQMAEKMHFLERFKDYEMSEYQEMLWNASFLSCWCLLCALLNAYFWAKSFQWGVYRSHSTVDSGEKDFPAADKSNGQGLKKGLLAGP